MDWSARPAQRPTMCGFKFTSNAMTLSGEYKSPTVRELRDLLQKIVDRGHGETQIFLHEDHREGPIKQLRLIEVNRQEDDGEDCGTFPPDITSVFLMSSYETEK